MSLILNARYPTADNNGQEFSALSVGDARQAGIDVDKIETSEEVRLATGGGVRRLFKEGFDWELN